MRSFLGLIGILLVSSSVWAASIADYAGTYPLDLDRSRSAKDDPEILRTVRLVIRPDKSIGWGAGKWHEMKLVHDLDEKGVAKYVESFEIGNRKYETEYTVQLHADGYIEINGNFFKVKNVLGPTDPGAGKKSRRTESAWIQCD